MVVSSNARIMGFYIQNSSDLTLLNRIHSNYLRICFSHKNQRGRKIWETICLASFFPRLKWPLFLSSNKFAVDRIFPTAVFLCVFMDWVSGCMHFEQSKQIPVVPDPLITDQAPQTESVIDEMKQENSKKKKNKTKSETKAITFNKAVLWLLYMYVLSLPLTAIRK